MLDFTELSEDGIEFEQMIREMLFALGYKVFWSGAGADGGKDLICFEEHKSIFASCKRKWLVQCKHKAISGRAVGVGDLGDIVGACRHHQCDGYLLATTTYPSSAVISRLEGVAADPRDNLTTGCWDAVELERMLSTAELWGIAQRYLPESATGWKIYASERPNHWTANYRGYYFHIVNRIGSECMAHLPLIDDELNRLEWLSREKFPEKHFMRLRSIYFDDKSGCYTLYADYMHPFDSKPVMGNEEFEKELEGEWNVHYSIKVRDYLEFSDHYDPDHYDFYDEHMGKFLLGLSR
ncbi:restriction endonuclease [Halodesulfovibrio marinisediminis]|uniref:Restriction endonuclease n=1 Tax=Halodesulfovibrio marinisediminis DSM 17456 TaxID=1121457 RepID=A0A1N6IF81_9BACT|nr:restriction endonuclease [Halodesulfovibrio marinisediminis]SIO30680.1 Restriction endonuclease [Halodesulfovibrio marinisediminis DSM 17456]